MALIHLRNLHLAFGIEPILDGVDFNLEQGERVCLIGRNGEGKSTLFKVISGKIHADSGDLSMMSGLKIAMLEQDILETTGKVVDIVLAGACDLASWLKDYDKQSLACANGDMQACEKMTVLQHKIDDVQGWDLPREVQTLLSMMDLDGEADIADLPGGRRRRVLLARALITKPDVLLLDEPTNHLDVDSIEWLEQFLLNWQGLTLLFISHDRTFIDKIATSIVELDRGVLRSYDVTQGIKGYARYQELKQLQLQAEEKANANFDKKLAEEEIWIRQGIKARRTRNEGRVRALKALRKERKARREQVGQVNINMNDSETSGKLVCKVKNLTIGYGDKTLIKDFNALIMRGDRIGIIGKNGVGKSTLIHAILGLDKPDIQKTGSIKLGTNLEIAFIDQLRDQLDLEATVVQNVAQGSDYVEVGGHKKHIIGYLQDFLFAPERARTPVKALSGGERNRVLLAKQLLKPANVLVLDEPTNDLDMPTLELLEEAVASFNGTILLISHDRSFMDNVVTSTWVFDTDKNGDGIVKQYVGGYEDYVEQKNYLEQKTYAEQKTKQTQTKISTKPQKDKTAKSQSYPPQNHANNTNTIKKKLTYKEQRELENLPGEIDELETEQAKLQAKLADGSWFSTDLEQATKASERLNEIDEILMQKLERWAELDG
ncbi:ABC transporter-like protein [Moraxella macacae 0408225]|uniref:ATP-binding protein Uup n=1 Tax=Moraxella macacae 0408225 TaxID=1230338 RepID=L2F571_9GAMM|nr:ATP-binding cassette domain-containing protein [Moraxella macacae]ELA08189.1 ABC transporter-like protein [Moraxella macacae 0408225]